VSGFAAPSSKNSNASGGGFRTLEQDNFPLPTVHVMRITVRNGREDTRLTFWSCSGFKQPESRKR
jgi:hypothetical protein